MDEDKPPRELLHDLGNVQQEKVALQYLLTQAADEIARLAEHIADPDERAHALEAAERFRRSAEL